MFVTEPSADDAACRQSVRRWS
jgi:alkylation response protein AidB-like acyl-CoA dehydrogenase